MSNLEGRKYSTHEFDSLMPLLNYRQLNSDGRMPETIEGIEVNPRILAMNSVVFRYNPRDYYSPKIDMYSLLESMPTRVGLKASEDYFRIKDKLEFIDAKSNTINYEKSERFAKALAKQGYSFPTQWVRGDGNTRKSYDEGYFCLDSKGELFHMKMVNDTPFIRNTHAADSINIAHYINYLPASRRFYGIEVSQEGGFYLLESNDRGGYLTRRLDIGEFDIERDQLMVMGNLLYWNVVITNAQGRQYYTLRSDDLSCIARHSIDREENLWDKLSKFILPFQLSFSDDKSDYIYPRITFSHYYSLILSAILALMAGLFIFKTDKPRVRLFISALVLVSGIAGLIATLILPKFRN